MALVDRDPQLQKDDTAQTLPLPLHGEILVNERQIDRRIAEIGVEVVDLYRGQDPLFICLLKGGVAFSAALMKSVAKADPNFHPQMEYMRISAYGDNRQAGDPELKYDLPEEVIETIPNRIVVFVDDVLESGDTVEEGRRIMLERGARRVDLVVLAQKNMHRSTTFGSATIYGFELRPDWLTGMGMDDSTVAPEGNRWVGFIALGREIVT